MLCALGRRCHIRLVCFPSAQYRKPKNSSFYTTPWGLGELPDNAIPTLFTQGRDFYWVGWVGWVGWGATALAVAYGDYGEIREIRAVLFP